MKWDWLTLANAAYMLYSLIVFWWHQFGYPAPGQTLTIAQFLGGFLFLALSFLMVAAALPDEVPAEGLDLREFYLESLRHRWGLLSLGLAFNWLGSVITMARTGTWHDAALVVLLSVILAAVAMRVRAIWYQALAIATLSSTTSYFNLLRPIGP